MPANLPPDYYAAERRYRQAGTPDEKITILREMLAIMPKHKGTEHLQGDLKRKIAKLQSQAQKKHATSRTSGLDHIRPEGAGQVVLVGLPNSGKSSILTNLTNAHSEVADYPFSTFKPIQGMMAYEDIQFQLVDLPPVSSKYTESWVYNVLRLADLVLLVIDLSAEDPAEQVFEICGLLEDHKILLRSEGESRPQGPVAVKSTLLAGTKADVDHARSKAEVLKETYGQELPIVFFSIQNMTNVDQLKTSIFIGMNIIRVYTKIPGKIVDMANPYVLPVGTTVQEAAKSIHKELADSMKFARLWGSDRYAGQRIERDHVMSDREILEIHTR